MLIIFIVPIAMLIIAPVVMLIILIAILITAIFIIIPPSPFWLNQSSGAERDDLCR